MANTSEIVDLILKSKEAASAIISLLKHNSKSVRIQAAGIVSIVTKINPHFIQDFNRRLTKKVFDAVFIITRKVVEITRRLLPLLNKDRQALIIQQLTELLGSQSADVRISALTAIADIKTSKNSLTDLSFHALTIGLRDDEPRVRKHALKVLAGFCRNDSGYRDRFRPLACDCVKDNNSLVSRQARLTLKIINQ